MKVLLQRVSEASVKVDGTTVGTINQGLLLLIGLEQHDNTDLLKRMRDKVLNYRVFSDENGKMNLSVKDINGGVLAISQFTLAADTKKGLRPGFSKAAKPDDALKLYQQFIHELTIEHTTVETGIFAADMKVSLINDGPVTFSLEM